MGWDTDLYDASYRKVPFDVLDASKSGARSQVLNQRPYSNDSSHEDLGGKPHTLQLTAIVDGVDYRERLIALESALDEAGAGQLVHPIYGPVNVSVLQWEVKAAAGEIDTCYVQIAFARSDASLPEYLPSADTTKIGGVELVDLLSNSIIAGVTAEYEALEAVNPIAAKSLISTMIDHVNQVRDYLRAGQRFLKKITSPPAWAGELLNSIDDAWAAIPKNANSLLAPWRSLFDRVKQWRKRLGIGATRPITSATVVINGIRSDKIPPTLSRATDKLAVAGIAMLTIRLLETELASPVPTLTQNDLTEVQTETRQIIQAAIAEERRLPDAGSVRRVQILKALALDVQVTTSILIERRPPVVTRTVPVLASVRWLAHHFTGRHENARLIVGLNPQIHNTASINAGVVINAYAE